jgi:hypothetical protein
MHGTRPWLIRSREANTSTPKVCGAGDTKLNEFVIGLLISADVIGLPHEAIPVSELESGTISCLASDVRFGPKADIAISAAFLFGHVWGFRQTFPVSSTVRVT